MRKATAFCIGTDPLLIDAMSRETLLGLRSKKRAQQNLDEKPEEEVIRKLYVDAEGYLGVPVDNLLSCLVSSGTTTKNGKRQISTAERTDLHSVLTIEGDGTFITQGDFVRLRNHTGECYKLADGVDENGKPRLDATGKETGPWRTDIRRGLGKQAKVPTAVCVVRPRFDEWAFQVTFEYEDAQYPLELILKLFKDAGMLNGLGGFRPNKGRGRFGRFKMLKVEEVTVPSERDEILIIRDGKQVSASRLAETPSKGKKQKVA